MTADYAQPVAATRRVRFFDGQFLIDQDFVDEQKYHIDRERRLGKVLRITGIAEGLMVSSARAHEVTVRAGTAIDGDGRQLVLADDRTIELPAATFDDQQDVRVLALYRETETDMATSGSASQRRWLEEPLVVAVTAGGETSTTETWDEELPAVLLAKLRLDNQGRVTVDSGSAERAGMVLPGALGIGGAAPAPGTNELAVDGPTRLGPAGAGLGAATVLGVAPGTVQFDGPNAPGGRLTIDGATGNVGIGTNAPGNYRLRVNGPFRLGTGEYGSNTVLSVAPGTVQFDGPNAPGGRLTIDGVSGNVGVGTTAPGDFKLSVSGRTRLGGVTDHKAAAVLSVAPGAVQFDAPNVAGGRLAIDGSNGNVGISASAPAAKLDVGGVRDSTTHLTLLLRGGNSATQYGSSQLGFGYDNTALYRHVVKSRHNGGERSGNALDFYVWKQGDPPETAAGQHTMTLDGGYVGIGTTIPRTALDTATGVLSGAANDYTKAQFALSGGGAVTWTGPPAKRLKWTAPFWATAMERGKTFRDGRVRIDPPPGDIVGDYVHDKKARSATKAEGVALNDWETLYAVHEVGGGVDRVSFRICEIRVDFHAPSNWILVAAVNGEDRSVKLGTGATLAERGGMTNGNLIPVGTIVMWSGAVAGIPFGWALCDGKNKTPDLAGRFVVGAAPEGDPPYNPGDKAEADQHEHYTSITTGALNSSSNGSHNHGFPNQWRKENLYSQTVVGARGAIDPYGQPPQDGHRTGDAGDHYHTVPARPASFVSTATNDLNRPRWYAICFIIKL